MKGALILRAAHVCLALQKDQRPQLIQRPQPHPSVRLVLILQARRDKLLTRWISIYLRNPRPHSCIMEAIALWHAPGERLCQAEPHIPPPSNPPQKQHRGGLGKATMIGLLKACVGEEPTRVRGLRPSGPRINLCMLEEGGIG